MSEKNKIYPLTLRKDQIYQHELFLKFKIKKKKIKINFFSFVRRKEYIWVIYITIGIYVSHYYNEGYINSS